MSVSKAEIAFVPSWRAATAAPNPVAKPTPKNEARANLTGAVTYVQPSGADVFPGKATVKAIFKKLRRGQTA